MWLGRREIPAAHLALAAFLMATSVPRAVNPVCNCAEAGPLDLPGCTCYLPGGQWPPVAGYIGDVLAAASKSFGAQVSCYEDRGLPYWQIQRQFWTAGDARALYLRYPATLTDVPPEPWCTETIAFWHWLAARPYGLGYWTRWWNTPFVTNTADMRDWYWTEEKIGGRGRWIDSSELDYADFVPGVNGPCPGAYQKLEGWDGGRMGPGVSHSQMIDTLFVHRLNGSDGPIQSIDVLLVEGNVSEVFSVDCNTNDYYRTKVRSTKKYEDIIDYTLLGDKSLATSYTLKIRGWGIDLAFDGEALCDSSRIVTKVTHTLRAFPAPAGPDTTGEAQVNKLVAYRNATQNGPTVSSNSPRVTTGGAWPTATTPWVIPSGSHPVNPISIDLDLLAEHPVPVRGVTILWMNGLIPPSFQVWWAGSDLQIHTQTVTAATGTPPLPQSTIPHFVRFGPNPTYPVRYARVVIPGPILPQTYAIAGFYYNYVGGAHEIAAFTDHTPDPVDVSPAPPARALRLHPNVPNPFNPGTTLAYELPERGPVRLAVYDAAGRRIATVVDAVQDPGRHEAVWNGRGPDGARLRSGVYFARLAFGGEVRVRKILLVQ
jgi:hypothetical protein